MPVNGYEWRHLVKMTPQNGSEEIYDLQTLLSDASGPVRTQIDWRPEVDQREDVNRRGRSRTWGFRLACTLTFDIMTMTDQAYLVTILERLALRPLWRVDLSLDAGAFYEQVELVNYGGPSPLGGKTFVGGRFEIGLRGVELLDRPPAIATTLGAAIYTDISGVLPEASLFPGAIYTIPPSGGDPSRHYISSASPSGNWAWELWREGPPV